MKPYMRMKVDLPVPFSPNITTISESVNSPAYNTSMVMRAVVRSTMAPHLDMQLEVTKLDTHVWILVVGHAASALLCLECV